MKYVVVFGDGETWSGAEGVRVVKVTDQDMQALEEGEYPKFVFERGAGCLLTDLPLEDYVKSRS